MTVSRTPIWFIRELHFYAGLRLFSDIYHRVSIEVEDNGIGIAEENLTRIFAYGFTTRKEGHGFGLHSAALAAKELGGSLAAQSDGLGTGASFTLDLPCKMAGVLLCTS